MRIVAGKWRGRALSTPQTQDIRPTSDRLRESVFNILSHHPLDPLNGARVLDLFAGTGALGFESLSRGAAFALFVDEGIEARSLLRQNSEALGAQGQSKIFRRDATHLGPLQGLEPFTLVFADPPYGKGLAEQALISACDGEWLSPGALAVIEEAEGEKVELPAAFIPLDRRVMGKSCIVLAQFTKNQP
jgi:16S rRNA (guanine966-N2)-methyltransferase